MKRKYLIFVGLLALLGCNKNNTSTTKTGTNTTNHTSSNTTSHNSSVTSNTTSNVTSNTSTGSITSSQTTSPQETGLTSSDAYPNAVLTKLTLSSGTNAKITEVYEAKIDGEVDGYLYVLSNLGYSDTIPFVIELGISSEEKFVGYKVIDMNGEVGVGKKIGTDTTFTAQFNNRDINYELDLITGATMSSTGVVEAVDAAIAHFKNNFAENPK